MARVKGSNIHKNNVYYALLFNEIPHFKAGYLGR